MRNRPDWVSSLNNNKAICQEMKNNPNMLGQIADYIFLMERAIAKGQISEPQAKKIFSTDMKNLARSIEKKINAAAQKGLNDQTDLTNPVNMQLALQNSSSYASMMMDQLAGAITESLNETQENILNDINLLFQEEDTETNLKLDEEKKEEINREQTEAGGLETSNKYENSPEQSASSENNNPQEQELGINDSLKEKAEKFAECAAVCVGAGEAFKDEKIKDTFENITGIKSLEKDIKEEMSPFQAPKPTPTPHKKDN